MNFAFNSLFKKSTTSVRILNSAEFCQTARSPLASDHQAKPVGKARHSALLPPAGSQNSPDHANCNMSGYT
jgi:hypothetical protein